MTGSAGRPAAGEKRGGKSDHADYLRATTLLAPLWLANAYLPKARLPTSLGHPSLGLFRLPRIPFPHALEERIAGHGAADEITLGAITSDGIEEPEHFPGLDPFGARRETQLVGQQDHGLDHGASILMSED